MMNKMVCARIDDFRMRYKLTYIGLYVSKCRKEKQCILVFTIVNHDSPEVDKDKHTKVQPFMHWKHVDVQMIGK